MLEFLARNPGSLVTRQTLLKEIWGTEQVADTGYLRLYMSQLRKKLEPDPARPGTCSPSRAWATASSWLPPDPTGRPLPAAPRARQFPASAPSD